MSKAFPEEAMPDIIRLIHGNNKYKKGFLTKEFFEFWRRKTSREVEGSAAPVTAESGGQAQRGQARGAAASRHAESSPGQTCHCRPWVRQAAGAPQAGHSLLPCPDAAFTPGCRFDRGTLYCSPPTSLLIQQQLRVKQACIR